MEQRMSGKIKQPPLWWGDYTFALEQTNCWNIGPMVLHIQRQAREWKIASKRDETSKNTHGWNFKNLTDMPVEDVDLKRFIFENTNQALKLTPLLADRPMVIRPETPIQVPAAQKILLYVSTPLWIRIEVHEPVIKLMELPIIRPSDTWFGPTTMQGEICYASQTHARLNLEDLPQMSHRAVTPVTIHNKTDESFQLERVNLAVPHLSLYCCSRESLWTESVTMVREPDNAAASLEIGQGAPEQLANAVLVSEYRKQPVSRSLISKVTALFE